MVQNQSEFFREEFVKRHQLQTVERVVLIFIALFRKFRTTCGTTQLKNGIIRQPCFIQFNNTQQKIYYIPAM